MDGLGEGGRDGCEWMGKLVNVATLVLVQRLCVWWSIGVNLCLLIIFCKNPT